MAQDAGRHLLARSLLQLNYNLQTPVVEARSPAAAGLQPLTRVQFLVIIASVTMGLPAFVYLGTPPRPGARVPVSHDCAVWKWKILWKSLKKWLRNSAHRRLLRRHRKAAELAHGDGGEEVASEVPSMAQSSDVGSGSDEDWDVEEAIGEQARRVLGRPTRQA